MLCYRIMSEAYYKTPYEASGSAGRWNPRGTKMIYACSSASLALFEYLCIRGTAVASKTWYMLTFEITSDSLIGTLDMAYLPRDWNSLPHGRATQEFGRTWLDSNGPPFLRVPSARMNLAFYPKECNLLINPDFPELQEVLKVIGETPISYQLNG